MERQAPTKSEYLRGEVFAMAGASFAHTMIASNMLVSLAPQLKRRSCTAHSSDLRVKRARHQISTLTPISSLFAGSRSSKIATGTPC